MASKYQKLVHVFESKWSYANGYEEDSEKYVVALKVDGGWLVPGYKLLNGRASMFDGVADFVPDGQLEDWAKDWREFGGIHGSDVRALSSAKYWFSPAGLREHGKLWKVRMPAWRHEDKHWDYFWAYEFRDGMSGAEYLAARPPNYIGKYKTVNVEAYLERVWRGDS